jgi:hypothetical protein
MNKQLKCFIISPAEVSTRSLKHILQKNNVIVDDIFHMEIGGSIERQLTEKIKDANFVIAILTPHALNVYYEIGICTALKKPLFIIVEKTAELPSHLQNRTYLRTSITDNRVLNIAISTFISDIRKGRRDSQRRIRDVKPRKLNPMFATLFRGKIKALRKKGSGENLSKLIVSIFNKLNLKWAADPYSKKDVSADFAIWDSDLDFTIGNPIFVELKSGELSDNAIKKAEVGLANHIMLAGARAGLLFYLDRDNKRFLENPTLNPLIIRFDVEDFIAMLSKRSFSKTILLARNEAVHHTRM